MLDRKDGDAQSVRPKTRTFLAARTGKGELQSYLGDAALGRKRFIIE